MNNSRFGVVPLGPPDIEITKWNHGTAKRRKRSAAGRAAGSHSTLVVPLKSGKRARGDPVEGRKNHEGVPGYETVGGKHDEGSEL